MGLIKSRIFRHIIFLIASPRQIHQDEINKCFYLEGMFENSIKYSMTGANILVDQAKELISVRKYSSTDLSSKDMSLGGRKIFQRY